MNTLETVTIAVTAGAAILALTPPFHLGRGLKQLGRQGGMWFEHDEDRAADDRPSEDAVDAPLPRRRLRTRY